MKKPAPRRAGRQPERIAEQTRTEILRAARTLFAQHEFDAVALRDIAAAAGTTHGLLRHHFGTKQEIWRAVCDDADLEYANALSPLLEAALVSNSLEGARTFVREFVLATAKYPHTTRLLMREGASAGPRLDYILSLLVPLRTGMARLMDLFHARGLLRQFDGDTFLLFLLVAGAGPSSVPALAVALTPGARRTASMDATRIAEQHAERLVETLFPTR